MFKKVLIHESLHLIKDEILVLDFVKEYLNNNRYFKEKKIISYVNSRLSKKKININKNGIINILKSLIKKKVIVEDSKLIKDDLLLNSNRKNVYDHIIKNPGVHLNKLVKTLNISVFTIEWHLNMLIKFNYIRKKKIDNLKTYFDLNLNPKDDKVLHFFSREKYQKIIDYFRLNNDGYTKSYISKELGMHPYTITKYIEYLNEYGLLLNKKLPNKTLYFLNETYYNDLKDLFKK